jgi:hypothetical protein
VEIVVRRAHAMTLGRKFGFELEGTHKAYGLGAAKYADTHAMARSMPKQKI